MSKRAQIDVRLSRAHARSAALLREPSPYPACFMKASPR